MSTHIPPDAILLIELSSGKVGHGVYASNGSTLKTNLVSETDTGKIQLKTQDAVDGDIDLQNTIIDRINAVKHAAYENGITRYRIVATAPLREGEYASDKGSNFADKILAETGLYVDILTGDDEAHAIATAILSDPKIASLSPEPTLIIDMGGKSTEFISVDPNSKITGSQSFPFGHKQNVGDINRLVDNAVQRIAGETAHPTRIIYSGSVFRHSVKASNQAATPPLHKTHTPFSDFMTASSNDGSLARAIDFPKNSVAVASTLAQAVETTLSPNTVTTSTAKIPTGVILTTSQFYTLPKPDAPDIGQTPSPL